MTGVQTCALPISFPQAFGLPGEETIGPGGFANALRTVPALAQTWADVAELAPDALVINLTNFNSYTWFDMAGNYHSDALQVVERYTPLNADTLQYEATMTDPKVFTRPWTLRMDMRRLPSELLEVACLEDDQDLPHLKDVRDAARRKQQP